MAAQNANGDKPEPVKVYSLTKQLTMKTFSLHRKKQLGASLVEYVLLLALVCIVTAGAITKLGREVRDSLYNTADLVADPSIAGGAGNPSSRH